MIQTTDRQPSNHERIAGYYARLSQSNPTPMELGWRAEAGMRYLRSLASRPSALAAAAAAHGARSPQGAP